MFENDNKDTMSEFATTMSLVTTTEWKHSIDYNVYEAFPLQQSSDQHLNPSSDVDFWKAINLRGELYKLSAQIGSYNVSSEHCSMLYIDKH